MKMVPMTPRGVRFSRRRRRPRPVWWCARLVPNFLPPSQQLRRRRRLPDEMHHNVDRRVTRDPSRVRISSLSDSFYVSSLVRKNIMGGKKMGKTAQPAVAAQHVSKMTMMTFSGGGGGGRPDEPPGKKVDFLLHHRKQTLF
jgi:hypothetical protein